MFVSAFAALVLFTTPEAAQAGAAEAQADPPPAAETKAPRKSCYTIKASGSRLPVRVCETRKPKVEEKVEQEQPPAE